MGAGHPTLRAFRLDGVPFSFVERMSGVIDIDATAATRTGDKDHRSESTAIGLQIRIKTHDLGRFLRNPQHRATITGTVNIPRLGGIFDIRDGQIELFAVNPETGIRQLIHSFHFMTNDGRLYFFKGYKNLLHEARRFDVLRHLTHLFFSVYRGIDESAPVYGVGVLRFRLTDTPAWVGSMKCETGSSYRRNLAARIAFLSVVWGVLRNEYFKGIRLFYETQYENLVLAGRLENRHTGTGKPFFFASGVHDKGFPYGDSELFSDVLLVICDGTNEYRAYAITDRVLPGLAFDAPTGTYRYDGPIFAMSGKSGASWSQMRSATDDASRLRADIDLQFDSGSGGIISFPFPRLHSLLGGISSRLIGWLWTVLPGTNPPGIHIGVQTVAVRSGSIRILRSSDGAVAEEFRIGAEGTSGECEHGTFRSVKRLPSRYTYRCFVDPRLRTARAQVVTGALGGDGLHKRFRDRILLRTGSAQISNDEAGLSVTEIKPPWRESLPQASPVLDVSNDQYPTAVFHRRIIEVEESGERVLALEEISTDVPVLERQRISATRP